MTFRRLALVMVAAALVLGAAGCGGHANPAKLHPTHGAPYRDMGHGLTAVYLPTEKGRRVMCYVRSWGEDAEMMSCDWAGYHARYGPGDPADQQ